MLKKCTPNVRHLRAVCAPFFEVCCKVSLKRNPVNRLLSRALRDKFAVNYYQKSAIFLILFLRSFSKKTLQNSFVIFQHFLIYIVSIANFFLKNFTKFKLFCTSFEMP